MQSMTFVTPVLLTFLIHTVKVGDYQRQQVLRHDSNLRGMIIIPCRNSLRLHASHAAKYAMGFVTDSPKGTKKEAPTACALMTRKFTLINLPTS